MPAPGVIVTTSARSGPTGSALLPQSGQYLTIGLTERGPVNKPQRLSSMADYRRIFGDRVTYGALFDDLTAFFESGGSVAQVLRVVGSAATTGLLTLKDGAGTPVDTVRFDASNPGAWSSRLTVQVEVGSAGATTRKITVRLDGATVEVYNNLASVAEVVSRFSTSQFVKVTDLGSATVAPNNLPAVLAATALSAGNDDRTNVNAARLTTQLALFTTGIGDGAIAAPGFGAAMHSALIAHAAANRRIALLTGAKGATVTDLATLSYGLSAVDGAQYAGLFGGWIMVPDGLGGTRTISPEGYVAASRAKAHGEIGPWDPAAGSTSLSPYVLGVDIDITKADAEVLSTARVNPIRTVQNRIRLYDWRSVSANEADYASLAVQDFLNRLVTELEAALENFVFRPIDGRGQLFGEVRGVCLGVLEPYRAAGGIFERNDPISGDQLDPGYSVTVDRSQNVIDVLARNELRAAVAVRPSPNASLINLSLVKVSLSTAV